MYGTFVIRYVVCTWKERKEKFEINLIYFKRTCLSLPPGLLISNTVNLHFRRSDTPFDYRIYKKDKRWISIFRGCNIKPEQILRWSVVNNYRYNINHPREEGNNYKVKPRQKNGRKEEVRYSFRVADCSFDVMQIVFKANNASRQFPTTFNTLPTHTGFPYPLLRHCKRIYDPNVGRVYLAGLCTKIVAATSFQVFHATCHLSDYYYTPCSFLIA